jgi:hypothetical protein
MRTDVGLRQDKVLLHLTCKSPRVRDNLRNTIITGCSACAWLRVTHPPPSTSVTSGVRSSLLVNAFSVADGTPRADSSVGDAPADGTTLVWGYAQKAGD